MQPSTSHFPFSAITGQPLFKLALLLTAVNPAIGGVLISGPRGSAKSTLARALADLLPNSGQFVTLPLGASEEMLIGSLDLQQALGQQEIKFNAGLLAKAHQGILYVDEVNLLPDALVDNLLDVSASRVNIIERDGISHQHDADFILIGTMNPDEGELRPQLQDRFGLWVELNNHYSIDERIEIVKTREAYDQDSIAFSRNYAREQQILTSQIQQAQKKLQSINCPDDIRLLIAERCNKAQVDGLRADLIWYRAALAHAAWHDSEILTVLDIDAVEELVLTHRRQTPPKQKPPSNPAAPSHQETTKPDSKNNESEGDDWGEMQPENQVSESVSRLEFDTVKVPDFKRKATVPFSTPASLSAGQKKGQVIAGSHQNHNSDDTRRINWFATLKHNIKHKHSSNWSWKFKKERTGKAVLHLILLDTSASVLTQQGFAKAKGVILQIAEQAYLAREKIMILGFGHQQVNTILPQVKAPKKIQSLLDQLPASGGTPIEQVLQQAHQLLTQFKRQQPQLHNQTYLLTDGRIARLPSLIKQAGLGSAGKPESGLLGRCVLIDIEQTAVKRGRGKELAQQLNADYYALSRGDYA